VIGAVVDVDKLTESHGGSIGRINLGHGNAGAIGQLDAADVVMELALRATSKTLP
jgi:hypothetical protein